MAVSTSLSLYVGSEIQLSTVKKQLEGFGILVITIHSASGLEKTDTFSKSDPYVLIQYARLGRPLYSTRIITNELHPRFEETAYILVTSRAIQAQESISAELWDSDRLTADDQLGRTKVNVQELVRNKGKLYEREDELTGYREESRRPGKLKWSIVYHGLKPLDPSRATDGKDPRIPEDMRKSSEALDEAATPQTSEPELPIVMRVPPDPHFLSGIVSRRLDELAFKRLTFSFQLSVTVGQIVDLAIRENKGSFTSSKKKQFSVGQ